MFVGWVVNSKHQIRLNIKLFHGGSPYHIETSPLIRIANQWTGFYEIKTSAMKELTHKNI